ncbi:MAG TPA: TonB family protein [Candidatus Binatia bacterium]|nr:TonB family protein [Candidatus Binatia bacterium]
MGYQALLFCPDEKTARTVTQVLSELDFEVTPCTEPFAAVKKLMAERFDAVVVDCDNEQNATLLFKSARNTANNQAALAVAVVEGQAGVAKAFRIGANLVLTKPINIEQAKGTLRVARGLLRKNDGAKPVAESAAGATQNPSAAPKPAASAPTSSPRPVVPTAVAAKTPISSPAVPKAPAPPVMAASAASHSEEDNDPLIDILDDGTEPQPFEAAKPQISKPVFPSPAVAEARPAAAKAPEPAKPFPASAPSFSGAASGPAPAREPVAPKPQESSMPVEVPLEPRVDGQAPASPDTPAPSFTFGGNVGGEEKPAPGGSKKILLAVAVIVVLAAGGYAAWSYFSKPGIATPSSSQPPASAPKMSQPAPATSPAVATPIPAPVATAPSANPAPPQTATEVNDFSEPAPATTETAPNHKSKAGADSPKAVANKPAPVDSGNAEGPAPIVLRSGNSPATKKSANVDAPAAPSLNALASDGSAPMPGLMPKASAPTPVLQTLHVSQGVSRGLLIKETPPAYPPAALRTHVEGNVELMATISKNGEITAIKILSGDSTLSHAAADAVKQWKYKPYLLNGEPVEIQTQITVKFKLPG